MSVSNYEELKNHIGHKIVCVHYGNPPWKIDDSTPVCENVAIECETCNEVLVDFDKETEDEYEESIVEVSEGDFVETFGRPPKNEDEWSWFVHYVKKGVEAQLDWPIIYDCTRDLKDTILSEEEEDGA
ncbi:hypothetical protein KY326_04825 [Candidatus Woesearchaeota archaeon]|nr:hypothetical protein [Candidatus Woesearchaeota archaeon]